VIISTWRSLYFSAKIDRAFCKRGSSISDRTTTAPLASNRLAIPNPIAPPPPVITAICPWSKGVEEDKCNFLCCRFQYSISKIWESKMGIYSPSSPAFSFARIVCSAISAAIRASLRVNPRLINPNPAIRKTRG